MSAENLLTPLIPDSTSANLAKPRAGDTYIARDFQDLIRFYSSSLETSDTSIASPKASFFQEKTWQEQPIVPLTRTEELNDWILPLLLICFSILAWIRVSFYKRFNQLLQASYSKQHMSFLLREGGGSYDLINLSLGFIFISASALLLFQFSEFFSGSSGPGPFRFLTFLTITGGIILWLLFRLFLIRLLSWTFKTFEITTMYLMSSMAFHFIIGILLLPLLVINAYTHSPFFLYLSLGFASILFILRLFRGILIGLSDTKFSIFYLFFYLCTVEILPILVIVKFAKDSL